MSPTGRVLLALPLALAQSAHDEAVAACAQLNFSLKAHMMSGYGEIDGYTRNSGCGYECGRKTFRWDNGPQGFGDRSPAGGTWTGHEPEAALPRTPRRL